MMGSGYCVYTQSPPAAFYICVILSESYLEKQLALQTSEKDLS